MLSRIGHSSEHLKGFVFMVCRSILALLIDRVYWFDVLEYSLRGNSLATHWRSVHRNHESFTRFSAESLLTHDKLTDCTGHNISKSPGLLRCRSIFNLGGARSLRLFRSRGSLNLYRCECQPRHERIKRRLKLLYHNLGLKLLAERVWFRILSKRWLRLRFSWLFSRLLRFYVIEYWPRVVGNWFLVAISLWNLVQKACLWESGRSTIDWRIRWPW